MSKWRPIDTAPNDVTIIIANFKDKCLLTSAPHVWAATYVTEWCDVNGNATKGDPMWCEVSRAALNDNGEPTHWMPLPEPPK